LERQVRKEEGETDRATTPDHRCGRHPADNEKKDEGIKTAALSVARRGPATSAQRKGGQPS